MAAIVLTRQYDDDAEGKRFRIVLGDGRRIGRMYCDRYPGPRRNFRNPRSVIFYRFEFDGLPAKDPIVGGTWKCVAQRLAEVV